MLLVHVLVSAYVSARTVILSGEANGTQIANDAQYNTTGVTNRGPILLLNN